MLIPLLFLSCKHSSLEKYSPDALAEQNRERILQGWNTWDNRSILTYVFLPDELAVSVRIKDGSSGEYLPFAFPGNRVKGTEKVETIAHKPDGSFTELNLAWRNIPVTVQTVASGDDLYIRITRRDDPATCRDSLIVKNEFFYAQQGTIKVEEGTLIAEVNQKQFRTFILRQKGNVRDSESLSAGLNGQIYIACGKEIPTYEIDSLIKTHQEEWNTEKSKYGDYAESYNAIQNAVNWSVVYDPVNKEPAIPVARTWSFGWGEGKPGGWIRFCWDNFFVAYMQSMTSRELAFSEAIEMCNYIDEFGFVPNFTGPFNLASRDRSQPPVGSMMVKEIYKAHPEKWFLEKTFDQLLAWNRWWPSHRDQGGYLCWGSDPAVSPNNDKRELVQNVFEAASNESGLDNTPMYDGVPFDTSLHMLMIGDVGLMGLYVGDCEALADIASVLGRKKEEDELRKRAEYYRNNLKLMWHEELGIFLNKRIDTGEYSKRISPTNFYALIAKAATQEQAERMMKDHFYNPLEFWGEYIMPSIARNDTAYTGEDYWRGSIWAPMNFLVYYGMRNYNLPEARKDLSEKSKDLLLKEWLEKAYVRENYNAETGSAPEARSEHFYHWGALLGMINMIEEGFVAPPESEIN